MFMVTIHKNSWKKLLVKGAGMLGAAALLCGVVLGTSGVVDGARATAAAAAGSTVKSAEDMANFLLGYGVEVDVTTAQVLQVTIPKKFDESFKAFNQVILSGGMDLAKHKGKLVEKWILQSPNRTVEDQTAYAVLLVRDAKVIGGYLLYQPSGEVIGLKDTLDITTLAGIDTAQQTNAAADAAAAGAAAAMDAAQDAAAQQECAADTAAQPEQLQDVTVDTADPAAETAAEVIGEEAGEFPIE